MKIAIVGTGRVGLVVGTCLAQIGHSVTCIDIAKTKIKILNQGKAPFYEPGLDKLLAQNKLRLHFTTNFDSITQAKIIFLTVGTPLNDNQDSADLTYLMNAIKSIAKKICEHAIIVIKSTVPVGTAKKVKEYIKEYTNKKIYIVSNPEFLREGYAIQCFTKPNQVVIGFEDEYAGNCMEDLYTPFIHSKNHLHKMSHASAEMTKYAINSFLATKISFINNIANLCDLTHSNIDEVKNSMASDQRIGKGFLSPGPGYGGSCLIKDVKAILKIGEKVGMNLDIIRATEKINNDQRNLIFKKLESYFKSLQNKVIAIWGVSFKPNTDNIQMSSTTPLVKNIIKYGGRVQFYDPIANKNFYNTLKEEQDKICPFDDMYECLKGADALVLMTEWSEFFKPDWKRIKQLLNSPIIFDSRNIYSSEKISSLGFSYISIGKSTV